MANANWDMVVVLAHVCRIHLGTITNRQKGILRQTAKNLLNAGINPRQVTGFAKWWAEADWRGKRGDTPTPAQVRTEWGKYLASLERAHDELPVYT